MREKVPPGPRAPSVVQTIGWWSRPLAFHEGCRRRFGNRYTVRLLGSPPFGRKKRVGAQSSPPLRGGKKSRRGAAGYSDEEDRT